MGGPRPLFPTLFLDWTLVLGMNQFLWLHPDSNLYFTLLKVPSILGHCPLISSLGYEE